MKGDKSSELNNTGLSRDVGASQGVSLQFGVDSWITDYRQFEGAAVYGQCSCCRHQANLQLCRGASDNLV